MTTATSSLTDFPRLLRQNFCFLVEQFGFAIVREQDERYGYVLEYGGGQRRVILYYDYKEDFFYFTLIRGADTPYPNDQDQENIRPFYQVFLAFVPNLALKTLQPTGRHYLPALQQNAALLQQYGSSILKGEEWM